MTIAKYSADQLAQLKAIDERDRETAIELGFVKFCEEKKLTKEEYESLYKQALEMLAVPAPAKA